MYYTINELQHEVFHTVYDVYEVFKGFFGESKVDLQGLPPEEYLLPPNVSLEDLPSYDISDEELEAIRETQRSVNPFILVYWPIVRVTNENDRYVIIYDLYAKVNLDYQGFIPTEKLGFTLNRATYPLEQWQSDYLHSHISGIPKINLAQFKGPCLGTGPIIRVIDSLRANLCEGFDEVQWMLFCQELSQYVQVESLEGRPYKYLEYIKNSGQLAEYNGYTSNPLSNLFVKRLFKDVFDGMPEDFITYYLKNGHLSINYQNGQFIVGMPYFDYIIDISNTLIDYINSNYSYHTTVNKAYDCSLLRKCVVSDGKFFSPEDTHTIQDYAEYIGRKVCTFKGREITLNIVDNGFTPQETIIIDNHVAMWILQKILRTINFHYQNEYTKQLSNSSTAALPSSTGKRVYYI